MKKFLFYILLATVSLTSREQIPTWYFFNTGIENTHIVLVQPDIPMTIDDEPMVPGDYIGAFYFDEFGNLKCGTGTGYTGDIGGMVLNGSVNAATIWGSEPNVHNGFQVGEEFKWKVYRSSDGSVFDAFVTYDTTIPSIPDSDFYVTGGLSKLASLVSYSIPGIDMSVNTIITPLSGCGITSGIVTITLQNHDTVDATNFEVSYILNEDTITELFTDTIPPDSIVYYSFANEVDLSQIGTYFFLAFVDIDGDVNYTNDAKWKNVTVASFPVVNIGNDIEFCEGLQSWIHTDSTFTQYLWNNGSTESQILVDVEGFYSVTITDALGCNDVDSLYLTVFANPQIELGEDVYLCMGTYTNIYLPDSFPSVLWSNNTTTQNLYISLPGTYSVTVTDENGCYAYDTISAFYIPDPIVDFGPDVITLVPDTTLDAGEGFFSYLWQDGSTNQSFHITHYGNFSVTVTTPEGCAGTDEFNISIGDSAEVFDDITLFPNPVSTDLTIIFPNTGTATLKIYDVIGKLFYEEEIEKFTRKHINVEWYSSGTYYIDLKTGSFKFQKPFVILKN